MLTDAVLLNQASAMLGITMNGLKVAQQEEQVALTLLESGVEAAKAALPAPAEGKGTVVDVLA